MLKTILSISGKPGLYKLISQGKNMLIVESVNAEKKRFPAYGNEKIISLADIAMYTDDEEIKLYMIGYNQGPTLALTNDGIKVQITQGYISQNTDSIKIMYSIPALQGSSGSPVVNQYGELVAINFAGINNTQGFNYGIRVERLREIVNDKSVKDRMTVRQSKNKPINNDSINSIESINN